MLYYVQSTTLFNQNNTYSPISIAVALIGTFIRVRKGFFSTIIRSGLRTDYGVSIHWLDFRQQPLPIEMEGRPFYTIYMTPDWIYRMSGMMCSVTPNWSYILAGTMCYDRM